jgi:hypothetical protein
MGWKIMIVGGLVVLWIIWPKIRVPKNNYFRQKLGAFATYLLLILGVLAVVQVLDYFVAN